MNIVSIIYNFLFIPVAKFLICLLKPFNSKLNERENNWKNSLNNLVLPDNKTNKRIWIHSASMGEFEQIKSVIEILKNKYPNIYIIVSFFSPSGFNTQQNYPFADAIVYLPFDTAKNAKYFINLIQPDIAIFIRYEIWRNLLIELKNNNILSLLVCATYPSNKLLKSCPLFRFINRSNFNLFSEIITIGDEHSEYFNKLKLDSKITTLSDTRFDRIAEKVIKSKSSPILPQSIFKKDSFIIVAGSTWKPCEDIIIKTIHRIYKENKINLKFILVPHEPNKENLNRIKRMLPNTVYLSSIICDKQSNKQVNNIIGTNHIIVDSIGHLLNLYSIGHAAFIGGGLTDGVHSVAEAAGYGIPLCSGPNIECSQDAKDLHNLGALTIINNESDFYNWILHITSNSNIRNQMGNSAKLYIFDRTGSSKILSEKIMNLL